MGGNRKKHVKKGQNATYSELPQRPWFLGQNNALRYCFGNLFFEKLKNQKKSFKHVKEEN